MRGEEQMNDPLPKRPNDGKSDAAKAGKRFAQEKK